VPLAIAINTGCGEIAYPFCMSGKPRKGAGQAAKIRIAIIIGRNR